MAHSFISKGKVVRNGFPGNRRTRMEKKREEERREEMTSHEHRHRGRKEVR